ncbi:hypothetical protein V5O48_009130 [Marasmius crinis-equi]|uniref:Xylanolytic transcriptional activator regulatory domain-containing protein n=1 Tax=Marasmius crinis-equi TaxID=585013 RepID=A0ABR3FBY5_9AGAR
MPPPYYPSSLELAESCEPPVFVGPSDLGSSSVDSGDFMLTEIFLAQAAQFGFFLNTDRFRKSVLRQSSSSDTTSPSKALISVASLWGVHLSEAQSSTSSREAEFLRRALTYTGMQMTSDLASAQILELIQAKVLLGTYFLRRNRPQDSDYHIDGAVSLCLAAGLHRLDFTSSDSCQPPGSQQSALSGPVKDLIDEGERLTGFWTVFALQRHSLIARHPTSSGFGNLESCQEITSPWPPRMEDSKLLATESLGTLKDMWSHATCFASTSDGCSEREMYVKAMILLQKAVYYLSRAELTSQPDYYATIYHGCVALSDTISDFQLSLPSHVSLAREYSLTPETDSVKRQSIQLLIITHSIASCAQLKVHQLMKSCGLTDITPHTCIDVALGVLQSHYRLCSSGCAALDPVASTLCSIAYEYLLQEQAKTESESVGLYWLGRDLGLAVEAGPGGANQPPERHARILVAVEESRSIMTYLSTACPCINHQFERLSKLYDAHLPKSLVYQA